MSETVAAPRDRRDAAGRLDPTTLAVLAGRFDTIVNEMRNVLQRSARGSGVSQGRDLSCSILTSASELVTAANGLPVHIFGSQLQHESLLELQPVIEEGDAFLHNDPYLGNSHPADVTVLVPVFIHGRHRFTSVAKAHMADIGNALPTSYMPWARDLFEEGGLNFPCIRVESGYAAIPDIIRLIRSKVRVPDQWFGDYQAILGAARVGERRLVETVERYGEETIDAFVREWFDYSERQIAAAIGSLPRAHLVGSGFHDPFPGVPDGIPLKVEIDVDPQAGVIDIDLRDNVDCVPSGINGSVASTTSSVFHGIFNILGADVPRNAGSFRRLRTHMRENCIVGIPARPHSCSMATSSPANRLVGLVGYTFAQLGDGYGLAEGGPGRGAGGAVIAGVDHRTGHDFVGELSLSNNGGPASPHADGWVTFKKPVIAGLTSRSGVELAEQTFPILVESLEVVVDGGGAGRFRGAPPVRVAFTARDAPIRISYQGEGTVTPGRGVRGGRNGSYMEVQLHRDGTVQDLPNVFSGEMLPGDLVVSQECGGGGYGDPLERDPDAVRRDVEEHWVSEDAGRALYGVALRREGRRIVVDAEGTRRLRAERGASNRD